MIPKRGDFFENSVEEIAFLYRHPARSRRRICAFDARRDADIPDAQQAAAGSAGLAFSSRVDASIHPDGHRLLSRPDIRRAEQICPDVYGIQLVFNFFWSIIFFNLERYLFAFLWLVALWILIFITTVLFYKISKPAGYLMIPYLLWVALAGYLNFFIYLLN